MSVAAISGIHLLYRVSIYLIITIRAAHEKYEFVIEDIADFKREIIFQFSLMRTPH